MLFVVCTTSYGRVISDGNMAFRHCHSLKTETKTKTLKIMDSETFQNQDARLSKLINIVETETQSA